MANENGRKGTKRNFTMICLAYVLTFTSLNAAVNLQSSINTEKDVGLNSVAIMFGASILSCLLFTTPICRILGYKWPIIGGQLGIMIYVAANMYSKSWLMYTTASICGLVRACMATSQSAYISALAGQGSENDNDEGVSQKFFSIFLAAYQSAEIWGNLISYIVLRDTPRETKSNLTECGANSLTSDDQISNEDDGISRKTMYILFGTFVGIIFISIILTIRFLDQKRDTKQLNSQSLWRQSRDSTLSTLKTLYKPAHLMLLPLGFWSFASQTFFMGAFTNSFITCTLGVQYVGLIMGIYGVTATLSSIVIAFVSQMKYARLTCFIIASLISYTIFIVMLIWKPMESHTYIFFILPCLSSISDGITEPFITALYDRTFAQQRETAFSMLVLVQHTSCLIIFLYTPILRVRTQIILQLIYLTIAMLSYILISIQPRRNSVNNDNDRTSVLHNIVMIPTSDQTSSQ